MADERGIVRDISWRDLCPWLILTRIFSLATSMQMLVVALTAVAIVPLGWRALGYMFTEEDLRANNGSIATIVRDMGRLPGDLEPSAEDPAGQLRLPTTVPDKVIANAPPSPIVGVFLKVVQPFRALLTAGISAKLFLYFLLGCLWTILVWAMPAAIITRAAALQLGREEYLDWDQAFLFAFRKFPAYVASPLAPLLGIFVLGGLIMLAGVAMRIPVLGPLGVGAMWFLVLLLAFVMALIALGLLFGWPLMWGTLGVENSDAFDALSRSYAYTYQRPLNYLFYGLVAAFLGCLGWLLVSAFVDAIVQFATWAAAWGYSVDHWNALIAPKTPAEQPGHAWFAAALIAFWNGTVMAIASAFAYSFFWCSAVAFYLLLRRDVDQMEMDEVAVDAPDERFALPKLKPHASGVPSVVEITPAPGATAASSEQPPAAQHGEPPASPPSETGSS